jgi:two-component system response regulator RegA
MSVAELAVSSPKAVIPAERSLLIVEDDKSFLQRLAKALETRGFDVTTAESDPEGHGINQRQFASAAVIRALSLAEAIRSA